MNPFVASLLAAGVRWLLTVLAARGFVVSDDQTTQAVSAVVAVATLLWSFAHKSNVDDKIKDAQAGL